MSGRKTKQKTSKRRQETTRRTVAGRQSVTHALSHVDPRGRVKMVDVGEKVPTLRTAVAKGRIQVSERVIQLILRVIRYRLRGSLGSWQQNGRPN